VLIQRGEAGGQQLLELRDDGARLCDARHRDRQQTERPAATATSANRAAVIVVIAAVPATSPKNNYCALSNTTRARRAGLFLHSPVRALLSGRVAGSPPHGFAARCTPPHGFETGKKGRKSSGEPMFCLALVLFFARSPEFSYSCTRRMRMGALRILKMARGVALP
jgi:hypothetical protein